MKRLMAASKSRILPVSFPREIYLRIQAQARKHRDSLSRYVREAAISRLMAETSTPPGRGNRGIRREAESSAKLADADAVE